MFQPFDTSDGLSYYQARYYDSALNRFIQPDSIIPDFYNPQYLNRYSYVRNNPVRYTDPTGHCDPDDCTWRRNENDGWDIHEDPVVPKPIPEPIPAPDPYRYMVRIAPPDFENPLPNGNPPPPVVDGLPNDKWEWNDKWPGGGGRGYRNQDDPSGNIYRPDKGYTNKKGNEGEDTHWNKHRPGDDTGQDYPRNPGWGRPGERDHPGTYNPRTGQYDSQPSNNGDISIDGPIEVGSALGGAYILYRILKVVTSPTFGPFAPAWALSP